MQTDLEQSVLTRKLKLRAREVELLIKIKHMEEEAKRAEEAREIVMNVWKQEAVREVAEQAERAAAEAEAKRVVAEEARRAASVELLQNVTSPIRLTVSEMSKLHFGFKSPLFSRP